MNKRFLLGVCLLLPAVAAPQPTPPHLLLVQGLRDRQLPDLALQYLQQLKPEQVPADLLAVLPFELARCRLEMAQLETDLEQRIRLCQSAQADLQTFLTKQPQHPRAAEARLEIARASAIQGRARLSRARRQEDRNAQRAELAAARNQFETAGKQMQSAMALLDGQVTALANSQEANVEVRRQNLLSWRRLAGLELGIVLLDQAATLVEPDQLPQRAEIVKQAMTVLEKLSADEPKDSYYWLARAWLGRCYVENDDPRTARRYYAEVLKETGEASEAGRRLAAYFQIQVIARDPDPKNPLQSYREVERQGDLWLKTYRQALNTPEGYGVRFELANACLEQALRNPKAATAEQRRLFLKAQSLFQGLEQTDSEYAQTARERRLNIILTLAQKNSRGNINLLRNFEECYLRALYEVALLRRAENDPKGPLSDKEREEHLANIIQALHRAVELADTAVSAQELSDARYLLTQAYFAREDWYRAAVLGEDLARTNPQGPRSPAAATLALHAYASLLAEEERSATPSEVLDADRNRLHKLATFVEQTWPTDPAADLARHQLGRMLVGKKDYVAATEALNRISATYANSTSSLYLLAQAALQADKAELKPPAGNPPYAEQAVAALQAIPDLSPEADAGRARVFFEAKLQLGSLLYARQEYKQLGSLASVLQQRLQAPGSAMTENLRAELRPRVLALDLLARFGQAEADYRAGRFAQVCEALDPLINQIKDPASAGMFTELKEPSLVTSLLGLALRANVQDSRTARAREILELLQKSSPERSLEALRELVRQLGQQLQELKQKGEAGKELLNKVVGSFSFFLEELAKQQRQQPDPAVVLFLADSYSNLGQHKTAADLLLLIREPQTAAGSDAPDPKQLQVYRAARILYVRALRQDRQFDKARAEIETLSGTPQQPGWGQRSLDLQKERIFLLEDQERYGGPSGAVQEWNRLLKQMQPRIQLDAKVREQYFECYFYLTRALYKNALRQPEEARRRKGIQHAVNFLVQLEASQPDLGGDANRRRFEDLLQQEPPFREQYQAQKKLSR